MEESLENKLQNDETISSDTDEATDKGLDWSDDEIGRLSSTKINKPIQNPPPREEDLRLSWLVDDFEDITENIYEAIMIASRRARQIGRRQKQEIEALNSTLEVVDLINNEEEEGPEPGVDHFHHMKPTIQALKELKEQHFTFSYPEEDVDEDRDVDE